MKHVLSLALFLCLSAPAFTAPTWHETTTDGYALWDGDRQIGWVSRASGEYSPIGLDGKFGPAEPPPVAPPADVRRPVNHGVDLRKIKNAPAWSINGKACTREQAMDAVEQNLADDSQFLRVTVVGDKATADKVKADLDAHPSLAAWKAKVLFQAYAPDHWAVRVRNLPGPGVHVQAPGRKIASMATYDGPEELERLLSGRPKIIPVPAAPFGLSWPVVLLGGAGAYLLLRKGNTNA